MKELVCLDQDEIRTPKGRKWVCGLVFEMGRGRVGQKGNRGERKFVAKVRQERKER